MIKEFEGKTEQEAIAKAMAELGLDQDEFDVEIMEASKGSLFKKGSVKIRIHVEEEGGHDLEVGPPPVPYEANPGLEQDVMVFVETVLERMGYRGSVSLQAREDNKLILDVNSPDANILIGKHGKNLDSLQLLANVYAGKLMGGDQKVLKIVLDMENYRNRREDHLVRLAVKTAQQVRKQKVSRLLEPMNPFERRLIHTALNDMKDIHTESEGDGLIKQVRISYTGN